MVQIQTLTWEGYDHEEKFRAYGFGRTEKGESVCVKCDFNPYFHVGLKRPSPTTTCEGILNSLFSNLFPESLRRRSIACVHRRTNCDQCEPVFEELSWDDYKLWGVVGFERMNALDLWGFQEHNKRSMVKVTFKSARSMKWFKNKIRFSAFSDYFELYEANLDPIIRLLHTTGCSSTGWLECPEAETDVRETNVTHEYEVDYKDIKPLDRQDIAPFRIGSFDIECYSKTGAFPKATNTDDLVYQIGMTRQDYGNGEIIKRGIAIEPCDQADTKVVKDEKELLIALRDLIIEWDLDIITGWNVWGFDFEYIMKRFMDDNAFMEKFTKLGRFTDNRGSSKLKEKVLSSSALGDNMLMMLPMSGRFVFDLMQLVKRELSLDSYSLNNVSKTLLNDSKLDMPPVEMFDRWRRRRGDELGEVMEYCIKDTLLPLSIMDKLKTLPNLIEMAKATWVPLNFLVERGQQIKVFSLMVKNANENGYCIPTIQMESTEEETFKGATVLEPKKGAYYEPIVALDFASLYPSIIRAHNLCYSTYVFDNSTINEDLYEYEKFEIDGKMHYFVMNDKTRGERVFALLPKILADLKNFRSQAKKDMAKHKGTPLEEIYNGKQLAYKVVMNSVYGFTGVIKGMLGLKVIAAAVTTRGREMIDETKRIVESNFESSTVVYGDTDSVMVKFNLPDTMTMEEKIAESWRLGEKAAEMCKFPPPNELELEKVYCPFILYSKKRYAAKMWVQNRNKEMVLEKIDIKGLQVIRRDQTPFVRETGKNVLKLLLDSRNANPVIDYVMERGKMLMNGEIDHENLLETRSLKDDGFNTNYGTNTENYPKSIEYNKRNLPHVWVRDKMWDRKPGSEPRQGERVSFLVTDTGNTKHKLFEKAEDPVFVKENNIKLDYLYYLEKLKKPLNDLLSPITGDTDILEALNPKIKTVEECETKEDVEKFSTKELERWCKSKKTISAISKKWSRVEWVNQVCLIKKINKSTPLESFFSFNKFK